MKYFEAFSGIGGFSLAIRNERPDWECVGFSEIDKYAIKVFEKNFPGVKNYGSITTIKSSELPDFDLFTFGFPCQDLSIAGKRAGLEGKRSGLFNEAIRIINEKRPDYFIFENVKGLFSSNDGKDFEYVLRTIADIRYDGQWQLLNTKWFLPQNRERVYFVGHSRKVSRPEIFPIGENGASFNKQETSSGENNTSPIRSQGDKPMVQVAGCLSGGGHSGGLHSDMTIIQVTKNNPQGNRINSINGNSTTLSSQGGGQGAKTGLYCVASRGRGENNEQQLEPREDGLTNSLTSVEKDNLINEGKSIRRLTPTECERLQGFPDNWTKFDNEGKLISDSQRYKMLGNAVSVPVVATIIKKFNQ